jgi:hypothetical protein
MSFAPSTQGAMSLAPSTDLSVISANVMNTLIALDRELAAARMPPRIQPKKRSVPRSNIVIASCARDLSREFAAL